MPERIQMTRQRPWRRDHPDAGIVARPSRWGNPYQGAGRNPDRAMPARLYREVVLLFRPECSPVKVDQGFTSGCHSHGFGFAGMDLIRGQDAMRGMGPEIA